MLSLACVFTPEALRQCRWATTEPDTLPQILPGQRPAPCNGAATISLWAVTKRAGSIRRQDPLRYFSNDYMRSFAKVHHFPGPFRVTRDPAESPREVEDPSSPGQCNITPHPLERPTRLSGICTVPRHQIVKPLPDSHHNAPRQNQVLGQIAQPPAICCIYSI